MGLPARNTRCEDSVWRDEEDTDSREASKKFRAGAPVAAETAPPAGIAARGKAAEGQRADGRVSWRRAIAIWIGAALLGWAVIGAAVAGLLRLAGAM